MRAKSFIYIIIAGLLWGTSGIFVHFLAPYGFSSLQMTAMRGTVSLVCIAVYALVRDRNLFKVKLLDLLIFFGMGAGLFGTAACYYVSMQLTSVSTAVVIMYMAPVYVMIYSVLFMKENFSKLKLVSLILMLMGCCLVSGIVGGLKFDALGIFWGFFAGVCFASYNILTKISTQRKCDPISATLYSFLFMSLISLSVCEPWQIVPLTMQNPIAIIPLMLGIGVVTFVVPYFLYTLAMRDIPAGTASALAVMEPMSATVYSIAFLGERPHPISYVGIVFVLLAVFLLGKAEGKHR